jgi:peptide/nickel transport system permease protein
VIELVARRLFLAIPTTIVLTFLLFTSVSVLLGSPAEMMLGQDASPDAIKALNARYGFDRPVLVQYFDWLTKAAQGDFGRSFVTQQSVAGAVLPAIPVTLELALWSVMLAALAATVLNSLPVARRIVMPLVVTLNIAGLTVPNFMIGISLIFLFSVGLGWLPSSGWEPWSDGAINHLRHIAMPVLTLSAYYFGAFSIVFRAEQKDVARRLFVQVARAKGLSEWMVSFKHALPNAILPVITFIGLSIGQLTGGAVVTETVFSMPGIGRLFVSSIAARDFPLMLAIGMLIMIGVVVMNLLADLVYTLVNPQIRYG